MKNENKTFTLNDNDKAVIAADVKRVFNYEICFTEFYHCNNGHVIVYFKNQITGMSRMEEYNTESIAKRESSKFHTRMSRVYSNYNFG